MIAYEWPTSHLFTHIRYITDTAFIAHASKKELDSQHVVILHYTAGKFKTEDDFVMHYVNYQCYLANCQLFPNFINIFIIDESLEIILLE